MLRLPLEQFSTAGQSPVDWLEFSKRLQSFDLIVEAIVQLEVGTKLDVVSEVDVVAMVWKKMAEIHLVVVLLAHHLDLQLH